MRCERHNKDVVTNCQWCGKDLCKLCIAKTNGKKAYCVSCSQRVGDMITKKQVEQIKEEEKQERKSSISNDYFDFSSL